MLRKSSVPWGFAVGAHVNFGVAKALEPDLGLGLSLRS